MKIRILIMIFFGLGAGVYGQNRSIAHRHRQVLAAPAEWKTGVEVVKLESPGGRLQKENFVRSTRYCGFSVYQEGTGYRLFFTDRKGGRTYEILGTGQPHRPFSDLYWKNERILVFDSWSNPHHGVHYEFDVKRKKIRRIFIFQDDSNGRQAKADDARFAGVAASGAGSFPDSRKIIVDQARQSRIVFTCLSGRGEKYHFKLI